MKTLAHFFSAVLTPLLMPFYGICIIFFFSYLYILPISFKLFIASGVLFFTAIIPAMTILWMYKTKKVKSIGLNDRHDREIPYMINLFGYGFCLYFLYKTRLPIWVLAFFIGCIGSIITALLINIRWKISAHLTGISGLTGLAFGLASIQMTFPIVLFCTLIMLTGILGSARIGLGRHTLMQVAAGVINGFIWVFGSILLISFYFNIT
ncbi:MAG: hypothetical protein KH414_10020 [Tannerella sp.]|jgi:hypothetical protein|uniref:hypothetical protein n=1 Tax=Coprobacter fastidiosus TaxID=1099853 RepID=UPI000F003342|nr:hypothetical protein [Coprobacter fastidiosus]MBS6410892.1 hypothetical protein [Tannerella sp.]